MDKTLEIIMVAMTLIVAAVVVISMLQGETREYGDFSDQRTNDSQCGFTELKFQRLIDCGPSSTGSISPTSASDYRSDYSGQCDWASSTSNAYNAVC